jgi:hypothetical protein
VSRKTSVDVGSLGPHLTEDGQATGQKRRKPGSCDGRLDGPEVRDIGGGPVAVDATRGSDNVLAILSSNFTGHACMSWAATDCLPLVGMRRHHVSLLP